MYNTILSSLKLLGFDDIDCEVYGVVLSNQKTNQLTIHKQTGIDRRKIKKSVQNLDFNGLIDISKQSQIRIKDPTKIIILLEFQEYELKRKRLKAKLEVEKFLYQFESTEKKIRFYDTHTQYVLLFNSMLENTKEIYHIGDEKSFVDVVGKKYFENWLQKRVSNNIKAFDLSFNLGDLASLGIDKLPNTEFKLMPYQNTIPGSIIFWSGNVAIFASTSTKVVVINDTEIYNIFVQLWKVINQLI